MTKKDYIMLDTICAISTPMGVGGISIIRLSGENAYNIALKFFSAIDKKNTELKPRYMHLGEFKMGELKEQCMCVYFKAPYSYTGEDVVEFQCHGGIAVTKKILEVLLNGGCRLAEAGEFTKRAFLNKKISLDRAEGVIDIINAESESELKAGYSLMQGNLQKEISAIQSKLTDILAFIDVNFDYPEFDDEGVTNKEVLAKIGEIYDRLKAIRNTADTGMAIKNGCRVVILGKPNAGKSSLMNGLLNYDRAIVTDIKGTTRDVIEEMYVFNGVKFVIVDTAGVRESDDVVEKIGVEKSKSMVKSADLVLLMIDSSVPLAGEDRQIFDLVKGSRVLVVVNKTDLASKVSDDEIPFENVVKISAKDGVGIDQLKQRIYDTVIDGNVMSSNVILTNSRHINALDRALGSVEQVMKSLKNDDALELVTVDINNVWLALGEITGETNNEEIINSIFMNFCVGK